MMAGTVTSIFLLFVVAWIVLLTGTLKSTTARYVPVFDQKNMHGKCDDFRIEEQRRRSMDEIDKSDDYGLSAGKGNWSSEFNLVIPAPGRISPSTTPVPSTTTSHVTAVGQQMPESHKTLLWLAFKFNDLIGIEKMKKLASVVSVINITDSRSILSSNWSVTHKDICGGQTLNSTLDANNADRAVVKQGSESSSETAPTTFPIISHSTEPSKWSTIVSNFFSQVHPIGLSESSQASRTTHQGRHILLVSIFSLCTILFLFV